MSTLSLATAPNPVDGVLFLTLAMTVAGLLQVLWLRARWSWRLAVPLDHGLSWRGRRLLGDHKTLRGFVLMVPASAGCFTVVALALEGPLDLWKITPTAYAALGALAGLGLMLGELPNSFIKRRFGIAPGRLPESGRARWLVRTGDRLDSVLGMLAVMSLVVPTPWTLWVLAIAIGIGVHGFFSHLLSRWGAKGTPHRKGEEALPLALSLDQQLSEPLAGAKASRLATLRRAGFRVPEGVVLTRHALDRLLDANSLQSGIEAAVADLDPNDPAALEAAATSVRHLINGASLPPSISAALRQALEDVPSPLAIRSSAIGEDSANASFAGQLDSILELEAASDVEAAVRRCWASRWSQRALFYERTRGVSLQGVAVVLQSFVAGSASGVLFTRDPQDAGRMLVELCEGGGESLVSGKVSPARLTLDRTEGRSAWLGMGDVTADVCRLAEDTCLSEKLHKVGLAAEELFGSAQDVEWTLDSDGRLVVLQSRPITTHASCPASAPDTLHWSSANIAENYPDPVTPFVASLARRSYRAYFETLGHALGVTRRRIESIRPQLNHVVGLHGGRLYYNLNSVEEILAAAPCGRLLSRYFGAFLGTPSAPLDPASESRLKTCVELARMLVWSVWHLATTTRRVRIFEATVDKMAARCHPDRLQKADWSRLRELFDSFLEIRLRRWQGAGLADAAAMLSNGALRQLLRRHFPDRYIALHGSLLTGLSDLASAQPVLELWDLSRQALRDPGVVELVRQPDRCAAWEQLQSKHPAFSAEVHRYLRQWGYRCSGELMLTVPSFQERPGELLAILEGYLDLEGPGPAEIVRRQAEKRRRLTRATGKELGRRRLLGRLPVVRTAAIFGWLLGRTQAAVALRERARLKQALLYNRCRRILLELGRRLVGQDRLTAAEDIFWLRSEEVEELLAGGFLFRDKLSELVAVRREAYRKETGWHPPENLWTTADGRVEASEMPTEEVARDRLEGVGACGGQARGRAALLQDMSQFEKLNAGDILVAPQTDPGWGPVFFMIGGLVLERGGTLSHGAIIAREFGIPAVVGVRGAFERIQHGAHIHVDGDTGRVALVG